MTTRTPSSYSRPSVRAQSPSRLSYRSGFSESPTPTALSSFTSSKRQRTASFSGEHPEPGDHHPAQAETIPEKSVGVFLQYESDKTVTYLAKFDGSLAADEWVHACQRDKFACANAFAAFVNNDVQESDRAHLPKHLSEVWVCSDGRISFSSREVAHTIRLCAFN